MQRVAPYIQSTQRIVSVTHCLNQHAEHIHDVQSRKTCDQDGVKKDTQWMYLQCARGLLPRALHELCAGVFGCKEVQTVLEHNR